MTKIYASTSSEMEERERKHMEISRRLAGECMVLLENKGFFQSQRRGSLPYMVMGQERWFEVELVLEK